MSAVQSCAPRPAPDTLPGPSPSLGPIAYFWPRERVFEFYRAVADQAPMPVYLGETVCSKRRELRPDDWIGLGRELRQSGHEVILSSLALIEAASELGACRRLVENGEFTVEANDYSAVEFLSQRQLPFVGGSTLNVYNHLALDRLRRLGLFRLVLPIELNQSAFRALLDHLAAAELPRPEFEIQVWGRLALAWSARCFTARAVERPKDQCRFECIHYPEGQTLRTREGDSFLNLNGVQVQSAQRLDRSGQVGQLLEAGIDRLRLMPEPDGTVQALTRFRQALGGAAIVPEEDSIAGYWSGTPGMQSSVPDKL